MLTPRDILILLALVEYYVLNRPQIQGLLFPEDKSGRSTRKRLSDLVRMGFINRQTLLFSHPEGGAPAAVYYPSRKGAELLAEHFDDRRFLLTPTQAPLMHHVNHWLAITETHITLNQAISKQTEAKLDQWVNEWDIVNKDEVEPAKRFRLYTLLREVPKLICAPDAAFTIAVGGHRKVFYLEQDRGTSGVLQIASSKTQGYAVMGETQWHRRHFPNTTLNSFDVIMITTTNKRRDALRKAFDGKPGAHLWRFTTVADIHRPDVLHGSILMRHDSDLPGSFIKPRGESPAAETRPEAVP